MAYIPTLGGVPVDAGQYPVGSTADVTSAWSRDLFSVEVAPVRDAIVEGQTALALEWQRVRNYAAAQSDPLRATEEYLQEIGWERGVYKQAGESDDAYRARVNARPTVVDPEDVVEAANAVLAPYSPAGSCRYAEESDGLFLADSTSSPWSSHLFDDADAATDADMVPNYPDRLYPDATPAGLSSIANRRPPGAMLNDDPYGRWFLLRAPDISAVDTTVAAVFDSAPSDDSGFFVADGTGDAGTYLFDFVSTVDQIYASLVGAVEAVRGHSMRWTLWVDPNLTA